MRFCMHSKSQEKKLTMQNMHYITIHKKLSPLKCASKEFLGQKILHLHVPPKN